MIDTPYIAIKIDLKKRAGRMGAMLDLTRKDTKLITPEVMERWMAMISRSIVAMRKRKAAR